ncbi:ABC-2 type transport system permease protein [Carnobacterium iners]|uniref:ABC-2 type transport system permease protein n=1 Tax=Carnobacterium iners TaxID=1073423 RepID=A0A1X7NQ39_9LACT|nr:ABC transporter permease [Carnobacterium iners]SEK27135.1 ABC-2 type transport system permease protein [Carnobacterium iners]SMH40156.1 ABC-2 type transport system permease protein [Carnobacterium iners]
MMEDIWKKRSAHYQKKMIRYSKYILNDHFVIVCLFLFGALGYAYSELLKTLSENFIHGRIIAVFYFMFLILIGKLATFLKEADIVFLLPKEKELKGYLQLARRYSMILPAVIIVFGTSIIMPLLVATSSFKFTDIFFFVVYLVIIKNIELEVQHLCMKISFRQLKIKIKILFLFVSFIGKFLLIFLSPLVGIAYALLLTILWFNYAVKYRDHFLYQWQSMVKDETTRVQRIYQFINLFTDVPIMKSTVRRRRYLDFFLNKSKRQYQKTYSYLYTRAFLRGTEYSGLFIRLMLIAMVLILFAEPFMLQLLLALLFLYLTGFQLIPLYFHFDNMAMAVLYPIDPLQKLKAIKQLLFTLLLIESLGIVVISLVSVSLLETALLGAALILFSFLFSYLYLPSRINKMEKMQRR